MAEPHVRDARPDDRGAIEAVTLAAYQEYAVSIPRQWDAYRQNILATLAVVSPAAQIVVEVDGALVGTALLYPAGTPTGFPGGAASVRALPEVRLLAVAPAGRGRGIGAALMRECARRAREAGAPALSLHTTDMMRAAQRLYARLGFRRAPELDFDLAPGVTVKGFLLPLLESPEDGA